MSPIKEKIIAAFCLVSLAFLSEPKVVHVYHDKASTPALLQMVNFIEQPENDLKIVAWTRYHNHIQGKENFKNTLFTTNWDEVFEKLSEYKKKYNRLKIILHYNIYHDYFYQKIYEEFKENLKIVHIYEDASMYMWRDPTRDNLLTKEDGIKKNLYMWGDPKDLCSGDDPLDRCPAIDWIKSEIRTIPINFHDLQKKLSIADKKAVFKLAGFDFEKYRQLLSNKPNGIYILGIALNLALESAQLTALSDVCQLTPDFQWFYKPHPNKLFIPTKTVLDTLCPNIQPLDAHIPFELLIIGGLKPTKVAGMSSSLFANLESKDILAYIQRGKNDVYLPSLKKAGILSKNRTYSQEKTLKKLNEMGTFRVTKEWPYSYWMIKIDDTKSCVMHYDQCGQIIQNSPTEKIIKWDNGNVTKLKHKKDYEWIEVE